MDPETKKINVQELEKKALELYADCPKQTTIYERADNEGDTDLHCELAALAAPLFVGPLRPQDKQPAQRDFLVPKQEVTRVLDAQYGLFSIVRVRTKYDKGEYALVVSVHSRLGFLCPIESLPFSLPTAISKEAVAA